MGTYHADPGMVPRMRAAIYVRISDDPTGRQAGVTRQQDDCAALAERLGWDVAATFSDNDISAYNGKRRPGFEAMLAALRNHEFDAVICWHTDRLYRRTKDLERLVDIADAVQIRTVTAGDFDLATSTGRMVARILASVAQQESEHHAERRVRANGQKAAAGVWETSYRPFGYTRDGKPLEPEASMVRGAVTDIFSGKSLRSIAKAWNQTGVTTTRGATWAPQRHRQVV